MAFCKVCPCSSIIVFETRNAFPEQCPKCGRRIRDFITYLQDDPQVEAFLEQYSSGVPVLSGVASVAEESQPQEVNHIKAYVLAAADGSYEIVIPPEGGIIGRGGIGAEQLAKNDAISREHLRITPRRNSGVIIQDVSTYGTKLNGLPVIPDSPIKAELNSIITLYDEELLLLEKEVECIDSV